MRKTKPPLIISAAYDGDRLHLKWARSSGSPKEHKLKALPTKGEGKVFQTTVTSTSTEASLRIPTNLMAKAEYSFRLGVVYADVTHWSDPITLVTTAQVVPAPDAGAITAVPTILFVSYAPVVGVSVTWQPLTATSGATGYQLQLYMAGQPVSSPTVVQGVGTFFAMIQGTLANYQRFTVRICAIASGLTGPLSPAQNVVIEVPLGMRSSYDGTNALIQWEAVRDERVTGYAVMLTSDGVVGPTFYSNTNSISLPAPAAQTNTVQVQALSDISSGPPSGITDIITELVTVRTVLYDGANLTASWSAALTPGASYRVELYSGAQLLSSYNSSATQAVFAAALNPAGTYTVRVRVIGDRSIGPASQPASIMATPVVMSSATTNAITGKTTLQWTAITNASYSLQLFVNGLPFGQPTTGLSGTSYLIPTALPACADFSAGLSATIQSGDTTASGPFGTPYLLPTAQPANVSLDYDGAVLLVRWTPASGATGYIASVFATGASQPLANATAPANATSVTFPPFVVDSSRSYSVVIQAKINADSGPPTNAIPLFTPSLFIGSGIANAPYIRPANSLAFANQEINLYLPDLGAGTPLQNLPITSQAQTFKLSANTHPQTNANYPYVLTIPATAPAWTFDANPIRSALQSEYISFLTSVETNSGVPWGISILQQAISRAMPQTFQETLYYAYGLNLPKSYADLRPGMVLRVILNDYNNVGPGAPSAWLNGYIGGSSFDYDISSYLSPALAPREQWTIGFDALLAQLVSSGAVTVLPPQSSASNRTAAGVAEAIDLFYSSFRKPFYRLFFPPTVVSPTGVGTTATQNNFVLAASGSYSALSATVNYPTATNAVAYFRGRVILKLYVRVFINDVEDIIPIGTTVGNILERYAEQIPSAAVAFSAIRLERALGLAISQPNLPVIADASYRVRLDWNHLVVYGPARDALSLPLLHGDQLTIG